jgi:hypothetical protein
MQKRNKRAKEKQINAKKQKWRERERNTNRELNSPSSTFVLCKLISLSLPHPSPLWLTSFSTFLGYPAPHCRCCVGDFLQMECLASHFVSKSFPNYLSIKLYSCMVVGSNNRILLSSFDFCNLLYR